MIVAEARKTGVAMLAAAGFNDPLHETLYLLSGILKIPVLELQLAPDAEIPEALGAKIISSLERRAGHEPAQYILGTAPFRDLELEVNPDVLIPRPETEELVSFALENLPSGAAVIDLGTGSGAIPVALKKERPDLHITAVDLSMKALETAARNAARYDTEINFIHSDLWQAVPAGTFDLVTANLPYVSEEEYRQCEPEIFFEPVMALTAPDNGLDLMKKAIDDLPRRLAPGGKAVFELGEWQNEHICRYGTEKGFSAVCKLDLEGKKRFAILYS